MSTPIDETSSLLRARDENRAHAVPSRVLGRARAALALALAFALACAVGVARVERGGRADVGALHRHRWTIASDAFPRGNRSCAFVSNDPHLRGLGASIDAHDEVIRLNNFYERAGGSANYGDKVTYLVSNTAHPFLPHQGPEADLTRELADARRCMLRYEPAFQCGNVCNNHNRPGQIEYTKSELQHHFHCAFIPKHAFDDAMDGVKKAQAADGPGGRTTPLLPSTGALAIFALAPMCAEVHFYGFTTPRPPYHEAGAHDMASEHSSYRMAFPNATWH
jgi:hypothetical protein